MVTTTRGGVQSKKKGKRKASLPPSPASSESSNDTIGEAFRESKANLAKRIKQEPLNPLLQSSRTSMALDDPVLTSPEGSDDFEHIEQNYCGLSTPPEPERTDRISSVQKPSLDFEVPADLLNILSNRDTGTKRFQGRIEEVLEDAFTTIPRSEDEAPGLAYIDYIIQALRGQGAAVERVEEVKQRLMEVWRLQMAGHLGRNIHSTQEVHDAVGAIVSALPFQPGHNGYSLPSTVHSQTVNGLSGSKNCVSGNANAASTFPPSCKDSVQDDWITAAQVGLTSSPLAPKSTALQDRGNAIVREDVHDYAGRTRKYIPDKDQFATPEEMFCFHLGKEARSAADQVVQDVDDGRNFSRRAVILFSNLSKHEQKAWKSMHRQANKDSLLEHTPARLLADQDILKRLERGLISLSLGEMNDERPAESIFIDFIPNSNPDDRRRVMLLVNLPDMPSINVTDARIVRACSSAFGLRPNDLSVESWSKHIWVLTLPRTGNADQAKGKAIVLNGRAVVAEHIPPKAPLLFTCDFTDIEASNEEVARQVAKAFVRRDMREARVKLEVQECKKLYPGRLFLITLPRSQKLIRFYIPVEIEGSDQVFMACFTPVNPTIPCSFCGDKHRLGRTCEHAQEVRLPSLD